MAWSFWRLTPRQWAFAGLGVAIALGVAWGYQTIDPVAVNRRVEGWDAGLVFAAMVVLPLMGFPVSVVHAVAGLRFGLGAGFGLVAIATLLQLVAAHVLVRLAPAFFARRLDRVRRRVPKGAHSPVTVFTMLLPGVPYCAQLYVLPVVGVPLATYVAWSWPINTARSIVGVAFGDFFDDLTPARLGAFAGYLAIVAVACSWAFRRLRRTLRAEPGENDGDGGPGKRRPRRDAASTLD